MTDLQLWALALVTGAVVLTAVSFDTSGWVVWSARFAAVCLLLVAGLLLALP